MALQKIPLFGSGEKAISPTITSQRRVNCFYDYRIDGENNQIVILQTPGLTRLATLPTSPIRAEYAQGTMTFFFAGNALYVLQQGVAGYLFLGTFGPANETGPIGVASDANTLVWVDGITLYTMLLSDVEGLLNPTPSVIAALNALNSQIN